jgi:hypothetical protein
MATALSKSRVGVDPEKHSKSVVIEPTDEERHAETRRRMQALLSDPDIITRYGHLLGEDAPEWEEDDSADEVPEASIRKETAKIREQFLNRSGRRD